MWLHRVTVTVSLLTSVGALIGMPQEFHGFDSLMNPIVPDSHLLKLDVVCSKDHMTVHLNFDHPFQGIIFSQAGTNHQRCVHLGPWAGVTETAFHIPYDGCGTVEDFQGHFYENTLIVQFGTDILEAWDEAKRLRCGWLDAYEKPSSKPTLHISDIDVVELNFQGDDVECWMEVQEGKGPWARQVGGLIPLGSPLTLVIAINDHSGEFDMRVKQCDAHDGRGTTIRLTDEKGCVLRPSVLTPFLKVRDFSSKATLLAYSHVYAFKFPDALDVFVRCSVELCRHGCLDSCDRKFPTLPVPSPRDHLRSESKQEKVTHFESTVRQSHPPHKPALPQLYKVQQNTWGSNSTVFNSNSQNLNTQSLPQTSSIRGHSAAESVRHISKAQSDYGLHEQQKKHLEQLQGISSSIPSAPSGHPSGLDPHPGRIKGSPLGTESFPKVNDDLFHKTKETHIVHHSHLSHTQNIHPGLSQPPIIPHPEHPHEPTAFQKHHLGLTPAEKGQSQTSSLTTNLQQQQIQLKTQLLQNVQHQATLSNAGTDAFPQPQFQAESIAPIHKLSSSPGIHSHTDSVKEVHSASSKLHYQSHVTLTEPKKQSLPVDKPYLQHPPPVPLQPLLQPEPQQAPIPIGHQNFPSTKETSRGIGQHHLYYVSNSAQQHTQNLANVQQVHHSPASLAQSVPQPEPEPDSFPANHPRLATIKETARHISQQQFHTGSNNFHHQTNGQLLQLQQIHRPAVVPIELRPEPEPSFATPVLHPRPIHVSSWGSTQQPSAVYIPKSHNISSQMKPHSTTVHVPYTAGPSMIAQPGPRFQKPGRHHYPYPIPQFSPNQPMMMMGVIGDRRMDEDVTELQFDTREPIVSFVPSTDTQRSLSDLHPKIPHGPRILRVRRSEPVFGVEQKFRAIAPADLAFELNATADSTLIFRGRREEVVYGVCMSTIGLTVGLGVLIFLTVCSMVTAVVLFQKTQKVQQVKKASTLGLLTRVFNGRLEHLYKPRSTRANPVPKLIEIG